MKKYKPEIGDKVRIVECPSDEHTGMVGKVLTIWNDVSCDIDIPDGVCFATKVEPYIERRGRKKGSRNKIVEHSEIYYRRNGIYYSRNGRVLDHRFHTSHSGQESDCPKGGIHDWRYIDPIYPSSSTPELSFLFYCTKCLETREKKI